MIMKPQGKGETGGKRKEPNELKPISIDGLRLSMPQELDLVSKIRFNDVVLRLRMVGVVVTLIAGTANVIVTSVYFVHANVEN